MAKYLLVVPSSAKEGRDAEYNDWYDKEHLRDICAIPGVTSGRRYDAIPQSPAAPPAKHLAIYEIEAEDPTTVIAEIGRRARAGEMVISSSIDSSTAPLWLYKVH